MKLVNVKRLREMFLAAGLTALAACAGSSAQEPAAHPVSAAPATQHVAAGDTVSDPGATCVASFVRQRECTDVFIPALVDARIAADRPAGIAAAAAAGGRDALVAEAKAEWTVDSQPEAIAATCAHMLAALPSPALESALAQAEKCLGETRCDDFVACELPIIASMLR